MTLRDWTPRAAQLDLSAQTGSHADAEGRVLVDGPAEERAFLQGQEAGPRKKVKPSKYRNMSCCRSIDGEGDIPLEIAFEDEAFWFVQQADGMVGQIRARELSREP